MGEFRVFSTLAYQIEPERPDPDRREDIRSFANNGVDCYVDPAEPRIVCAFKADSSHVSRNEQRFLAEYVPDDPADLFTGIGSRIRALESEGADGNWTLLRDDATNVVWELESALLVSLGDLGADLSLRLVLEELVEEGVRLDLGFTGYREAAAAATAFVTDTDRDPTIAVSSNGRTPAVESTDVVLRPGTDANFAALDDRTRSLIEKRLQNQQSRIEGWFEREIRAELDALVDGERELWPVYAELQRLAAVIDANGPENGFETEHAGRIAELVQALRRNEQPPGEEADPKVLTDDTRAALVDDAESWVADERHAIEGAAVERSISVLQGDLDDLRSLARGGEQAALRRAKGVLDGDTDGEFERPALVSFATHVDAVATSDALPADDTGRVFEAVRTWIDDRLAEIAENERDDLLERFDDWLDDENDPDATARAERLRAANRTLDDEITAARDQEPSRSADAVETVADASPGGFASLLDDLRANRVLSDDRKTSLRGTFRDRIEAEIEELRNDAEQRYRRVLSRDVESIANADEPLEERYRRLGTAKQLCAGEADPSMGTAGWRPGVSADDRLASLAEDLRGLRDHPLLTDDVDAVQSDLVDDIEAERGSLYRKKFDAVEEGFREAIEGVVERVGSVAHARLHDELDAVANYLDRRIDGEEFPGHSSLLAVKRWADEVIVRGSDPEPILEPEDRQQLRSKFKTELSNARAKIRRDKRDEIEGKLDDWVEEFRAADLEAENKIVLLEATRQYHATGNTPDISLPNQADEDNVDAFQEFVDRIKQFGGDRIEGGEVLETAEREDVRDYLEGELVDLVSDLSADLEAEVETEVKRQYQNSVVVDADSATMDELAAAIRLLRDDLRSEVAYLCNGSLDTSERLETRTIERAGRLEKQHGTELEETLQSFLDAEADRLERRHRELARERFLDAVDELRTGDEPFDRRLIALEGLHSLLRGGPPGEIPVVDGATLRDHYNVLTADGKGEVRTRVDDARQSVFDAYERRVAWDVAGAFRSHFEYDDRNTNVAADTFLTLFDEGEGDEALRSHAALGHAVRRVDELRELKPHLDTSQYQSLSSTIREVVERYERADDGGGSSSLGRIPVVGGALAGAFGGRPSRRLAGGVGALVLLGLFVASVAAARGAVPASSLPAPIDGVVASTVVPTAVASLTLGFVVGALVVDAFGPLGIVPGGSK